MHFQFPSVTKTSLTFIEINECSPDPCQNGATCMDLVGSYRCDCKSGYTGSKCETGSNLKFMLQQ